MVLWPDLRADLWKKDAYDSRNITAQPASVPRTYTAVAYPAVLDQDAYLTYRMDAPTDITRFVYGGRLHNYQAGSYIDYPALASTEGRPGRASYQLQRVSASRMTSFTTRPSPEFRRASERCSSST